MKDYYITWEGNEISQEAVDARNKALGSFRQTYHGVDGNISGRDGFNRADWDSQRGTQPVKHSDIMMKASWVYYDCSLIRNIIDLMADFTGQGLRISHPVKSVERFYRAWYNHINGQEITERFANYLYRYANVVIKKSMGKINKKQRKDMSSASQIIPYSYTFINPAIVEVEGGDLSCFYKEKKYVITIPQAFDTRNSKNPKYSDLQKDIKEAIKKGTPIPLEPETTLVYHYRKDDWCSWAKPILYSVFRDIDMLYRLELADRTALDGAISNIRIFKLGNVEKKLIPTEALFQRLDDVLQSHSPGGTIDIIWDEAISLEESKTTVHQFLGKEKYVPHLEKIYQGLGIPSTLAGATNGAGSTNNFISLKTLLQRLEHGRMILSNFWMNELKQVQEAMGFSKEAIVEFDFSNLTDDTAYKALLIQLADRNLISDELLQHAFNNNPELERARINKEEKQRDKGKRARKPGPYNEGDFEKLVLRDAISKGLINPSKTGIDTIDSLNLKPLPKPDKAEGVPGRPKNKKDSTKRQRQKFNPIGSMGNKLQAKIAYEKITNFLKPIVLKAYKKRALRDLTTAEYHDYDDLRNTMFFNLSNPNILTDEEFKKILGVKINRDFLKKINNLLTSISSSLSRELSQEEKIDIYTIIYNENLQSRT